MTDKEFLLAILADGKKHSRAEILHMSMVERGCGMTVHSRAADLRRDGHVVECSGVDKKPRDRYYQLVALAEPEGIGSPLLSGSASDTQLTLEPA